MSTYTFSNIRNNLIYIVSFDYRLYIHRLNTFKTRRKATRKRRLREVQYIMISAAAYVKLLFKCGKHNFSAA